jgi:hypothetical protein
MTILGADTGRMMLVKNWSFTGTGSGSDARYPFVIESRAQAKRVGGRWVRSPATFSKSEFTDQAGASGQGNANPPGWFASGDHALVRITEPGAFQSDIFDPSYGAGPFKHSSSAAQDAIVKWARASLDGFAKIRTKPVVWVSPKEFYRDHVIEASKGLK